MATKIGPAGLGILRHFEGLHDGNKKTPQLEPQLDCRGIPTLGWGSIFDPDYRRVTLQTPAIDLPCADELLERDTSIAAIAVSKLITVPLNQSQFDALVDFTYNLGSGRLLASSMRWRLNGGDYGCVPGELMKWVYGGGLRLNGLVLRRSAEGRLWESA